MVSHAGGSTTNTILPDSLEEVQERVGNLPPISYPSPSHGEWGIPREELNIRLASIDAKLIQFISEDLSIEEAAISRESDEVN